MSGPADGTKNGTSINAGQSCSEFGLMCVYKHRPVCDWNQVISDEELMELSDGIWKVVSSEAVQQLFLHLWWTVL